MIRLMKNSLIAMVTLNLLGTIGVSASELSQKMAERHPDTYRYRAQEAAVWAMPMMNFKGNRDGVFAHGITYNDVGYFSKMQDASFQLATPNDTTPYFVSFWDLQDKPVVIEMPAATKDVVLFGTFIDSWHRPMADFGPKGADKGQGAKYLIVPPGYDQEIPKGYIVIESKTFQGYLAARPIIDDSSQQSVDMAARYVRQLKVYYLGDSPKTRYIDLAGKQVMAISSFDDTYFDSLNKLLQIEPLEERNKVMMAMLKAIGMQKGKLFTPNAAERTLLSQGAKQAQKYLADIYHNVLIKPYYKGKFWQFMVNRSVPETGFTFNYPDHLDIDNRGALYYAITTSIKKLGGATAYILTSHDSKKLRLDGSKNYHLKIDANVPVKQFWSATVYDYERASWIIGQDKVSVSSNSSELKYNEDGSIDLYFGPQAPNNSIANWVGTQPGKTFFVMFRFYGPTKSVFDKSWQLNDIERLK